MASAQEIATRLEYRPTHPGSLFGGYLRVGKDVYFITPKDEVVGRFLDLLELVRSKDRELQIQPRPLVSFREDFRKIIDTRPLAGLLRCFISRTSTDQRRLAVWLLGRCGRASDAKLLFQQAGWCPLVVRREIIRSLRRLNALRECQQLALGEDDQRSRRIAGSTSRNFNRILSKWHVSDESAVKPPPRPFELLVEIGPDAPRRPKSRDILMRIQMLLRGAL